VSELITPSAKTAKMLAAYYRPEQDLQAEIEAANRLRRETLADIGALFSAFPDLNSISVSGYTPGWNDGDPCHHSQPDPYLNGENVWERDGDDEDEGWGDEEEDEREEDEREEDEDARSSTRLSDKDFEAITHILEGMSDVLEKIFGTNWKLIFRRTQNGIEFNRYNYDCGH
jgi:hypothetical protein